MHLSKSCGSAVATNRLTSGGLAMGLAAKSRSDFRHEPRTEGVDVVQAKGVKMGL
jgi:hypothetical protein